MIAVRKEGGLSVWGGLKQSLCGAAQWQFGAGHRSHAVYSFCSPMADERARARLSEESGSDGTEDADNAGRGDVGKRTVAARSAASRTRGTRIRLAYMTYVRHSNQLTTRSWIRCWCPQAGRWSPNRGWWP